MTRVLRSDGYGAYAPDGRLLPATARRGGPFSAAHCAIVAGTHVLGIPRRSKRPLNSEKAPEGASAPHNFIPSVLRARQLNRTKSPLPPATRRRA